MCSGLAVWTLDIRAQRRAARAGARRQLGRGLLAFRRGRRLFGAGNRVDPRRARATTNVAGAARTAFCCWPTPCWGRSPARSNIAAQLPLVEGVVFDPASETREGYLVGRKPRAVVFPLALPEWRDQPWRGGLAASDAAGVAVRSSGGSSAVCSFVFRSRSAAAGSAGHLAPADRGRKSHRSSRTKKPWATACNPARSSG